MGRTFTIRRVDKDLRAVVICTENSSETKPDLSDDGIAQAVLDAGVNFGLFENYVSIIRDACLDGTAKESQVVIAEALLPVDGQDGFIELQYNNILSPGRIDSESDKIDYKERQLFVICEENDTLAKVFPPTKGTLGTNVAGDKLKAKDGSEFPLRLGECARSEQCPGYLAVYARQNGIIFYDGKNLIDVVRYQCINGDVDYSTGNLSIEGSLRITGWVREGFSVRATESVIVEGGVEDALVEAGEDIVIHCKRRSKSEAVIGAV